MNDIFSPTASNVTVARKDAASYMSLFPDASTRCAPGAPQANTSHMGYLVYLKELIEALETRADVSAPATLQQRRPDLLQLKLDEKSAKKTLPALRLVLGLLESHACESLAAEQTLQQAVASLVHQGSVPFHHAWESIKATLAIKQLPLWDALRSSDIDHPSFIFDNLSRPSQRAATTLSSGFAPELQALLLDANAAHSPLKGLATTQEVSKALGLTRKALRQLLAVSAIGNGRSSVTLSQHISEADYYAGSSEHYGAAYINNGNAPLYLTQPDLADSTVEITGVTDDHLVRLQHIVHIQRALGLKPAEADSVVMAAIWAEDLGEGHTITAHTLRALGLFRHLQQKYAVSAHQYAAFICEIRPYGANGDKPFYDQLFAPENTDEDAPAAAVLKLDSSEFDPKATGGADALTVKQLCLALKVDETVLRAVLEWAVEAQGLTLPTRTIEVVSACYRLTALPRLFGMSPNAGMDALRLLAQEDSAYKNQLAGTPCLGTDTTEADIVDVIIGMMGAMQWLQQQTWGVGELLLTLQAKDTKVKPGWHSICQASRLDPAGDESSLHRALNQALHLEDVALVQPLLCWAGLDTKAFRDNVCAIQRKHAEGQLPPDRCFTETDIEDWSLLEQYSTFVKLLELSAGTLKQLLEKPEWFDLLDETGTVLRHLDIATAYLLTRYTALLSRLPKDTGERDVTHYLAEVDIHVHGSMTGSRIATAWAALESVLGEPQGSLARLTSLTPPTTLGEIDRLLRLLDLSQQQRLSVDALVELGALPSASTYTPFQQAATALRQSCTAKQRKLLDEHLSVAWRDALVNWVLASWVPTASQRSWINTPQALADYLLIDLQVSHEPRTTRVASAIASLQRYLHQVHSRQEMGYRSTLFTEAERDEWENYASSYEHWKLRQQVRNEPQNFIDPTRRARKTTAFKELENLLAQGKCQPQDIQTAMVGYLSTFEKLSNIQPISAYADGTSPLEDTYHFIGKTNVEPVEYYWRTLDLHQRDQLGAPSMLAWGEWEKIALPISGTLATTPLAKTSPLQYEERTGGSAAEQAAEAQKKSAAETAKQAEDSLLEQDVRTHIELVRPVIIAGRRYVVWVEWETTSIAMGSDNKPSQYYPLRVCFTFQQTDGAWSPPNELLRLDGRDANGQFDPTAVPGDIKQGTAKNNSSLKTKAFQPGLMVMVNQTGDRQSDPWLTVLLFDAHADNFPQGKAKLEWRPGPDYSIVMRDLLLIEAKELDVIDKVARPLEQKLIKNWLKFFSDPRVVQHPYIGAVIALQNDDNKTSPFSWSAAASDTTLGKFYELSPKGLPRLSPSLSGDQEHLNLRVDFDGVWATQSADWNIEPFEITHAYFPRPLRVTITASAVSEEDAKEFADNELANHFGVTSKERLKEVESHFLENYLTVEMTLDNPSGKLTKVFMINAAIGDSSVIGHFSNLTGKKLTSKEPVPKQAAPSNITFSLTGSVDHGLPDVDLIVSLNTHTHQHALLKSKVTITLPPSDNSTWTLPVADQTLLNELRLGGLKSYASNNPTQFSRFKQSLLKVRYLSRQVYCQTVGLPEDTKPGGRIAISEAVAQAINLNRAEIISDFISEEVTELNKENFSLPTDVSLETAVRLRHLHPAACRRILLYLDPNHEMVFEDTLVADGKGHSEVLCPFNRDVTHYSVSLTLADEKAPTEALGSATEVFDLEDRADDAVPSVQIRRNGEQALYMDFAEANQKAPSAQQLPVQSVRLNTLFGKQLVALATQSVERALSWEAQCLPEPAITSADDRSTVDFSSANGLYFWELFFHVPFLVAWQLRQNREYREAWRWCTRHLFDPYRTWAPTGDHAPPYWLSQPISGLAAFAAGQAENDPDLLAYAAPERYRKALHLFVADSWQRQGDDLYRQLTRDTLVEAAICYDKALRLIGVLPEQFSNAPSHARALAAARSADFVPPLNNKLIELRDLLRNRLFNLRHGLTLDGKPATLLLEPGAYNQLALGYGGPAMEVGGRIKVARPVPPCRYDEVRKSADAAVLQLIELGQTQLRFYESEGAQKLALLSKTNVINLLEFPRRLQEQALESAKRGRDTLLASKRMVEQRLGYYQGLVDVGITPLEEAAIGMGYWAQSQYAMSIPFQAAAGFIDAVPTIFGLAFGGAKPATSMKCMAFGTETLGKIFETTSNELHRQAGYQLRGQEWQFEADQARLELRVIDQQLLEQDIHIRAAHIAVEEARAQIAAHREEFQVMTTVFASHPTYLWLIGRLTDIYSTAYDATLSLCLMAQACLQYELGDFRNTWIRTDGWLDNWRGMLAGESLERDLIQMDVAAITNNERPLDIRLNLSLCTCMGWTAEQLQGHVKNGEVLFDLKARHFDAQYPGHYLRRIERIVLTFKEKDKTLSGPVAALLTQTKNIVLLSNDNAGAQRLYSASEGNEDNLLRDLRPNQQAAIWSAKEVTRNFDLQPSPKDETRYQPFEGTGAISSWVLSFPNEDLAHSVLYKDGKCVVTDIEIQISYSAVDGGPAFTSQVKTLLASVKASEATAAEEAEATRVAEAKRKADLAAAAEKKRNDELAAAAEKKRKDDLAAAAEKKRKDDLAAAAERKRKADAEKKAAEKKRKDEEDKAAAEKKRKAEKDRKAAEAKRITSATAAVTAARQAELDAKKSLKAAQDDAKVPALSAPEAADETQKVNNAVDQARSAVNQATTALKAAETALEAKKYADAVTQGGKAKKAAEQAAEAATNAASARKAAEAIQQRAKMLKDAKAWVGEVVTLQSGSLSGRVKLNSIDKDHISVTTRTKPYSTYKINVADIKDIAKG